MLNKLNRFANYAIFLKISALEKNLYRHLLFKEKNFHKKVLDINKYSGKINLLSMFICAIVILYNLEYFCKSIGIAILEIIESPNIINILNLARLSLNPIFYLFIAKDFFIVFVQNCKLINSTKNRFKKSAEIDLFVSRIITSVLMIINIRTYILLLSKQNNHSLSFIKILKVYFGVAFKNCPEMQVNLLELNCSYKLDEWKNNIACTSLTELLIFEGYYLEKDCLKIMHASSIFDDIYAYRQLFEYMSISSFSDILDSKPLEMYDFTEPFSHRLVMYDIGDYSNNYLGGFHIGIDQDIVIDKITNYYTKLKPVLTFFAKTDELRNKLKCLPEFSATHQELKKVLVKTNNDPHIANLILQYHSVTVKNKSIALKSNEIRSIFNFSN